MNIILSAVIKCTIVVILTLGMRLSGAQVSPARDLRLYNGDLEMSAMTGPPPGWAMWGSQRFKDPKNYTRETTNPHSGSACLRIFHPSGTDGYLVTDPAHAIHPSAGMSYTFTFWARSDKQASASFGYTAYTSIAPFVDGASLGMKEIKLGPDWRSFTFTLREGRDFFVDTCKYLLLSFNASRGQAEDGVIYVDDIVVTETPLHETNPLKNMDTIVHAPLQHRLTPGRSLNITVDVSRHERPATSMAGGISFHRVVGFTGQPYDQSGKYTLDPRVESAMREMHLPMTRIYSVGDEKMGVEAAIDRVAELSKKIGVAQENVVLELEQEIANRSITPEVWARAVRYSISKHYKFRYWEIANEPYSSMWQVSWTKTGEAYPTADSYIAHHIAVSKAIRKEQPDAQIGIGINTSSLPWGNQVLRDAAGSYDFVVPHYYSSANVLKESFDNLVLTANYQILDLALRVNALIHAYNPKRNVYQFDTEWGMISNGSAGEDADYVARNANVIGLVHRGVRLIYYAREGMLKGASGWQMLSNVNAPGFGILSQQAPDKQFLLYWLMYYFNRHVGQWVLPISGTAPYQIVSNRMENSLPSISPGPLTPVLATSSADGKTIYMVIANGSWDNSFPLRAQFKGFASGKVNTVSLSQPSMDSNPLVDRKEDVVSALDAQFKNGLLTATLPAHSVSFITITKGK